MHNAFNNTSKINQKILKELIYLLYGFKESMQHSHWSVSTPSECVYLHGPYFSVFGPRFCKVFLNKNFDKF